MIEKIENGLLLYDEKSNKLEEESKNLSIQFKEYTLSADESKKELIQMNYEFLQSSIQQLNDLFKISPFGEKILKPLFDLLNLVLNKSDLPIQELTLEEINKIGRAHV